MSYDPRKNFVLSTVANLGGWGDEKGLDQLGEVASSSAALNSFLDDPSCALLQAIADKAAGPTGVKLYNKLHNKPVSADTPEILFVKLRPEPITPDNITTNVLVTSLLGSPVDSLYHSVRAVFAPSLLGDDTWAGRVDSDVQGLLAQLEKRLGTAVRAGAGAGAGGEEDFGGIVTPVDEIRYWQDQSRGGAGRGRERAYRFSELLRPVAERFERLADLSRAEALTLVEDTQNVLEDVWSADVSVADQYPQPRMKHLFAVVAGALGRYVQTSLSKMDLWKGPFADVRAGLREGAKLCEAWAGATSALTATYWARSATHAWLGDPHEDKFVKDLGARLEEVLRLRTTHEELLRLLAAEERRSLRVEELFSPFNKVQPLHVNEYTQPEWDQAVRGYERKLVDVENHIAGNLRRQIVGAGDQPQQLLRQFGRYRNLLKRPTIARALAAERDALLAQLSAHIEAMDGECESRSSAGAATAAGGEGGAEGRNLSPVVNSLVWAKGMHSKVSGVLSSAHGLLGDLPAFGEFSSTARDLLSKLAVFQKEAFADWASTTEGRLEDGELSLEMTGRLMEFDVDGNMVVNYGESMVTLLREVRQLRELGLAVPRKVAKAAQSAETYYRYGVQLKKVANFYNTMGSQMIPAQKPMLYDTLLAFESVVQNPSRGSSGGRGGVTWSNPQECQEYVDTLQKAAETLSAENRKLRKVHMRLGEEVVALMNIDLLRQRDMWKSKWATMRDLMSSLSRTYNAERMAKWKLHWDHQLYKCVEVGYKMGLESLNENLSEIKCELVFSSRQLQFRPPLEELRANYYREMKKFISIPQVFTGFGNAEVFAPMADRNASSLVQVYRKAEILFARLAKLRDRMRQWVVLGRVPDLDAFVEETVTTVPQWESNFKALKFKRKECEKLPDFHKVDCVTVSAAPFKAAIEDQMQRFSDALVLSLRKSLTTHLRAVEEFLAKAMERLNERPHSIDEIGKAKREWKEISDNKPAVRTEMTLCDEQKKLLLGMAGSNVALDDVTARLSKLPDEWDTFEVALEAFNDMIEEQRGKLRGSVEQEVINVNVTLDKFSQRWQALKPKDVTDWSDEAIDKIHDQLEEWGDQLKEIKETAATLNENCESFMMPAPKFEGLDVIEADVEQAVESWDLYRKYTEERGEIASQDWITFRSRLFDITDFAAKWLEAIKPRPRDVVKVRITEQANVLQRAVPALKFCRGEPFKEEHWTQCFRKLGVPRGVRLDTLTVGHFLDVMDAVAENLQFLKELQSRAQGEVTIREALQELRAWAETAEFKLMDHAEAGRSTSLIREWKDLFTEVGDNQSLLQSLKESQYFKPFADQATQFEGKMALLDECLQNMNAIQRKWVYLEPIFGRGALPSEQARFRRVDDEFRDIMGRVEADKRVFNLADESIHPGLSDTLSTMLDQLERCQKALADYLEEKRSKMPRFYFIGDDDLLEILGQAKNPKVIQAHLKKLFQGVHRVEFNDDASQITAMCSVKGEVVTLSSPVAITEEVEVWLDAFSKEMCATLARLLVHCVEGEADLRKYPSQVLGLSEQVHFTNKCERALGDGTLRRLKETLTAQLSTYTSTDLSSEALTQLKVKALVLDLVHHMDVVDILAEGGVTSLSDWTWQKQLRFYLNDANKCVARMVDAEFDYTYEYQGNSPKLVHTPLTDKCYLTLTQGMNLGYGGNPYGPAGTGKTESVKALGAAMGRQVLVFNCDEGIDFHSMGRIFTGLVKCGAWGCFDEFNRLKEDQLSAVSQQIQVIQAAIKEHEPRLDLLGKNIDVDFNAGIFVTMNPAGKGYGGRSKLPDNLKQLFRPVAMSRPDNELIAEVILYSEGFKAKDLASKVVSLFTLSKQLLTQQQHYDWGLRALKTCLNTGGNLIQATKREGIELTDETERELLIKAVRVNTLSKLTFDDAQRFLALVGDVFPGVSSEDIRYAELEMAIKEVMTNKPFNLEYDEGQTRKMMQLKESLDQRMGCVIVGPSGCGKSTLWRVLQAALVKTGQVVKTYVMNPKSMPRQRLLGEMDPDTREWTDGVLTAAARQVVREPLETRSWIVCDGDVDPEWIESLNSVLDDNHLLTMPNGERISFGSNVNFLFETHDLRFASPATISRMGMIFLSDEDVDIQRVVKCWLNRQPDDLRMNLGAWMDDVFYRALRWVLDNGKMLVDTTMVGTVMNGLSHVSGCDSKGDFVCSLIRGLGGNLDTETRSAFAKEVFQWVGERPPDLGAPLDCEFTRGRFVPLSPPNYDGVLEKKDLEQSALIKTTSVMRTLNMLQKWVTDMEPFILVGPEGCGKTMLIKHLVQARKNTSVTMLHCNAQTSAEHIIRKIRQSCQLFSSNAGRVYRPREGDRLVLFLKDINLPKPDKYDTCPLIAFLQQLITFQGFYDEALEFLGIERIHIVATMNPATTVGRHHLSTRFTAIVRIAWMDYPSASELTTMYSAYLQAALKDQRVADPRFAKPAGLNKLAGTMVELFEQVRANFSVDDHRHYMFTPRDLTTWVIGMLRYNVSEEALLDVFAHEAQRLVRDRLVDAKSESKFDALLAGVMRNHWGAKLKLDGIFFTSLDGGAARHHAGKGGGSEGKSGDGGGAAEGKSSVSEGKGGDGTDVASGAGTADGVQAASLQRMPAEDFKGLVERGKTMYEREEKELHMLLFPEILHHVARVDRVLSQEGGSLLLVGRAGVGRRTATSLAAHMLGIQWMSCNITRGYTVKNFFAELKGVLQVAGVQGEEVVLFLEDHQFTEDAILETVNSLLASGDVPGLYTHEELEPLLAPLKELMSEEGFRFRTPYDFFVSRVQANLHVVLSMDPTNPEFLRRCESNPALYTRCVIQWMGEWRKPSMSAVPGMLVPFLLDGVEDPDACVEQMLAIHESCKPRGATPRDFITFLESYRHLYETKAGSREADMNRLAAGLGKLQQAAQTVDELSTDAQQQQVQLSEKQKAADEAMTHITEALAMASDRRKDVETLTAEANEAEKETTAQKADIESQLSEIAPILESAREAVGAIKGDHLNEIRSLKMPPEPIHDVLSAVLMLLGVDDTSWLSMKKFLGKRGVKDDILSFDARRITHDIRKNVSKVLKHKSASFEHKTIYRVSVAAAPMAAWVKANIRYSMVLDKIQPLEGDLNKATSVLRQVQGRVEKLQKELREIDANVARMKDEFAKRTAEAESLKIALRKTQDTLERAELLLGKLSGERSRWDHDTKQMKREIRTLPTQMLLAAGFVTYLAKSPEDVRVAALNDWQSICGLDGFDFRRLMSTESQLLTWKAEGLPADSLSMENALVILASEQRCPFVIDPATTATSWLQRHLSEDKSRPLEVVTIQDPRFQTQVELAVRFGKSLLIKEVDRVDPMLFPLVRRDLVHQGPRQVVQIGEKSVDYNERFRMFMVTRNPFPDIPADAASLITEVNFTVTRSGLEGQLLGVTLKHEQPKLETLKSKLLQEEEELKVQLATLEKQLLEALASSTGDILENTALIDSLTKTKSKSADIAVALEGSEKASVELDRQRDVYRPFAEAGSRLFFIVREMAACNHMYQFSLSAFVSLFQHTLEAPLDARDTEERIRRLSPALEKRVLNFVGRSLFKADRLMFATHMVHGMHSEMFGDHEWEFFVGDLVPDLGARSRSFPDWAAADREAQFSLLESTFPTLVSQASLGDPSWARWARSAAPEREWPSALSTSVKPFQRVLLVQTLRPDRTVTALGQFVCETMNVPSVAPPPASLTLLHDEESTPTQPILMITTTGADPSKDVEEFAAKKVGRQHYAEMAMGGGQQEAALKMVRKAAQAGDWILLKNLHLVTAWLPTLEKEIATAKPNPRFRLFLTTEAHDNFPTILLQQSLKVTYEAPPGLKKNLERTYEAWSPEYIAKGTPLRAQVLFLLAWFHSIVQERRTYVPQGWTKAYEFSFSDLRTGAGVIDELLLNGGGGGGGAGSVPWETIHGLMENAIYGGRVDNSFDFRVLQAYLEYYFTPDMLSGRRQLARGVALPQSAEHRDYLNVIGMMADTDAPVLFSLPDNIERSVQRAISAGVIAQLKALRSLAVAGASFDREKWRSQLGPLMELWKRLTKSPSVLDVSGAQSEADDKALTTRPPVDQFVVMEHLMASKLVMQVNADLEHITKVVYGSALLTPAVLDKAKALLADTVPRSWESKFEGPEQPTKWLRAVARRRVALADWADRARSGSLLGSPVDLSELFRPTTFLNALRQQTAREAGISMDTLKLVSCFDRHLLSGAPVVVSLEGMMLQGATFGSAMEECATDASELMAMPAAHIAWVAADAAEPYPPKGCLETPVYMGTDREKFLTQITVPITGDKSQWVLAGVALFLGDE